MRQLLWAALLATGLSSCTGCLIPGYSGDKMRRNQELIYTSENLRMLLEDWERLWMLDQPSHLSPHRTHGGII